MAARTLDNCSLIQEMVKIGVGTPEQYYNTNKCLGYGSAEYDDEPCEKCKNCRLNVHYGEE